MAEINKDKYMPLSSVFCCSRAIPAKKRAGQGGRKGYEPRTALRASIPAVLTCLLHHLYSDRCCDAPF
eukprot:1058273-Amphidinium_carterae.1